jgi:hypothetical protein
MGSAANNFAPIQYSDITAELAAQVTDRIETDVPVREIVN